MLQMLLFHLVLAPALADLRLCGFGVRAVKQLKDYNYTRINLRWRERRNVYLWHENNL